MSTPLISLNNAGVNLGDRWLLRSVDLSLHAGERLALVGRNGAGKSTLMKLITGTVEPDEGSLWVAPGVEVAYLPQNPIIKGVQTLTSYVCETLKNPSERHVAEAMLMKMDLDPNHLTADLSGGEARRLALAKALVNKPSILLLDEPTNHLDLPTIEWLEARLSTHQGALVIISHDRAFLRSLGNSIIWINNSTLRRRDGAFSEFEEWSEAVLSDEAVRLSKLDKKIAEETRWSRQGISARRKRNQGRLRELDALREVRKSDFGKKEHEFKISSGKAEAGGQIVIEARNLGISIPLDKAAHTDEASSLILVNHFNFVIKRRDRIGIVGPNGAGKSTLVRTLLGERKPDAGFIKTGIGLLPAYFDQKREQLLQEATPWKILCPDGGETVEVAGKIKHVTSYLRDFLFDDFKMTQRVNSLSGGEQNRLLLAKIFAQPHNFLVLDEPTNDLDLETIDLLQEVVADYDGTILIVSHDRDFIDRTVTSVLAFEDEGKIISHAGGYSDYLEKRKPLIQKKAKKDKKTSSKPKANTKERLTFKEKFLLKTLPEEIEAIEKKISLIDSKLSDMTFFNEQPEAYQQYAREAEALRQTMTDKEQNWLELELRRETLGEDI
ncbi:ATP-binding cassette domain-containing protein [Alphaproteobacteria bacterium]|nr:ATP-binding cassette domain-containing protein [Alphaproteobacteria bacterium]